MKSLPVRTYEVDLRPEKKTILYLSTYIKSKRMQKINETSDSKNTQLSKPKESRRD